LIIIVIFFIIVLIIYFTKVFFDNSEKTITLKDIYKFNIFSKKETTNNLGNNIKENFTKSVNRIELKEVLE
jgi:hypothetical protein